MRLQQIKTQGFSLSVTYHGNNYIKILKLRLQVYHPVSLWSETEPLTSLKCRTSIQTQEHLYSTTIHGTMVSLVVRCSCAHLYSSLDVFFFLLRSGIGERSIAICLSVCLSLCVSLSASKSLEPLDRSSWTYCAHPLWPWLGPPLAALRYRGGVWCL